MSGGDQGKTGYDHHSTIESLFSSDFRAIKKASVWSLSRRSMFAIRLKITYQAFCHINKTSENVSQRRAGFSFSVSSERFDEKLAFPF